ncbi:ATP-binding cassette domain-containing protein [Candidatus Uhrbacteria bacterium]|nr:ATP-binding cassette domain-containing protein [Candidatus Uhrbacteria bacterium]
MENIIRIKDIKKEFVNDEVVTKVLHGITFDIPKGQFVSIMGPSGSGKSTLMHILGFLDVATNGTYEFAGIDVSTLTDDELADMRGENIGFIFQTFNLLSRTSVYENVMLPLIYTDIPAQTRDEMVREAIADVGLSHRMENLSNQLSGGERQRVAIARALIRKPDVILADEPTGNLDSKSGEAVMDLIEELNKKFGHTIILVTHETYTAQYASRIIKLKDGLVVSDQSNGHKHKKGSKRPLK